MNTDDLGNFTSFKIDTSLPMRKDEEGNNTAVKIDLAFSDLVSVIEADDVKMLATTIQQVSNKAAFLVANVADTELTVYAKNALPVEIQGEPVRVSVENSVKVDEPLTVHVDNDRLKVHWDDQEVKVRNPISDEDLIPIPLITVGVDYDLKPEWHFRREKVEVENFPDVQKVHLDNPSVNILNTPLEVYIDPDQPIPITGEVTINNEPGDPVPIMNGFGSLNVNVTGSTTIPVGFAAPQHVIVDNTDPLPVHEQSTAKVTVENTPDVHVTSLPDVKIDATSDVPVKIHSFDLETVSPYSHPLPVEIFFAPNASWNDSLDTLPPKVDILDTGYDKIGDMRFARLSWRNPIPTSLLSYAGKTMGDVDHDKWWNGLCPTTSTSFAIQEDKLYQVSLDTGYGHSNKLNVST